MGSESENVLGLEVARSSCRKVRLVGKGVPKDMVECFVRQACRVVFRWRRARDLQRRVSIRHGIAQSMRQSRRTKDAGRPVVRAMTMAVFCRFAIEEKATIANARGGGRAANEVGVKKKERATFRFDLYASRNKRLRIGDIRTSIDIAATANALKGGPRDDRQDLLYTVRPGRPSSPEDLGR